MIKSFFHGLILSLLAGTICLSNPGALMAKDPFGFYYGEKLTEDLFKYETLVLDARNFASADLDRLKDSGVRIIAYLTIGETDTLLVGDGQGPGGYASWYFDDNRDGLPDQNPNWGSYYVNASDPKWHDHILNRAIPSLPSAIAGVFLDTVDTVDIFRETKNGMISLINKIALHYPQHYIVQNRGFALIRDTAESIDALLFEDYSTYYNFEKQTYEKWTGEDLVYVNEVAILLNQIRRSSRFDVWTLDYREADDQDLLSVALRRAVRYGFIPSTTSINITRLDLMNLASIDDETDNGLDGCDDIISAVAEDTLTDIRFTIAVRDKIDVQTTNIQFYIGISDIDTTKFEYSDVLSADYLVENDILYRYVGDGYIWEWEPIGEVSCENTKGTYTVTVNKALMNIGQNSLIEVIAITKDQGWNHRDQTDLLRIVTRMSQYSSEEKLDDTVSPPQDIRKIGASLTDLQMKITVALEGVIDFNNHYGLLMDTDLLEEGYQYDNISASYMILDNGLYRYAGDGKSWDWRLIRSIDMNMEKEILSYVIDCDEIEFTGNSAEIMGFSLNSLWKVRDKSEVLQILTNLKEEI